MGVDQRLINSKEGLITAGTDPRGFAAILGSNVGHRRRLGPECTEL